MCLRQKERGKQGMYVIQKEGASKLGGDRHRERRKLLPWVGVSSLKLCEIRHRSSNNPRK